MQTCENCEKEFDQKAALLRHISHKNDCKSYYGEERLKELRIDGKLEAKQKWWKKHASDKKVENHFNEKKKAKLKIYHKKRYVQGNQRNSNKGKCFAKLYKIVFKNRKTYALGKLDDSGIAYDKVHDKAFDQAVDLVFENDDTYVDIFENDLGAEPGTVEYDEKVERLLDESFDKQFEKQCHSEMDNWLDSVNLQIEQKCRWQGEEVSFTHFLEEFGTSIYPDIEKAAMDLASGKDFMREAQNLLENVPEDNQLVLKMAEKIDVKINKQIRLMKNK